MHCPSNAARLARRAARLGYEMEVTIVRFVARTACALILAGFVAAVTANAQTAAFFYYNEVVKEGKINVFASPDYEAAIESGDAGAATGIERPGYGPNGETVVFFGQNALNL